MEISRIKIGNYYLNTFSVKLIPELSNYCTVLACWYVHLSTLSLISYNLLICFLYSFFLYLFVFLLLFSFYFLFTFFYWLTDWLTDWLTKIFNLLDCKSHSKFPIWSQLTCKKFQFYKCTRECPLTDTEQNS